MHNSVIQFRLAVDDRLLRAVKESLVHEEIREI